MQLVVISQFTDCKIERTTHEKHNSPRKPQKPKNLTYSQSQVFKYSIFITFIV